MAKKRTGKNPAASNLIDDENRLPQNIITMGNKVEENKNIYISQPAYKAIHRFAEAKTENESGGMLIGSVIEEFGKTNIVIAGFIEAKYCKATPTTLKFTHETWDYCHKEIAKKFPGKKIVGWIHTHPNFGIFLSEYDKFIQENFFKEEYEIAFVVDPIQGIEGFYFWINEKIERCRGFYIFDKTGTRINIEPVVEKAEKNAEKKSSFALNNVIIAALLAEEHIQNAVADRITPLVPDEDTPYPCVVYQSSKPQRDRDLDGEKSDIGTMVMTYTVLAVNYAEGKLLIANIKSVLEEITGFYGDFQVSHIDVEEADESGDPEQPLLWFEIISTVTFKYLV